MILSIMCIGGILVNSDELRLWQEGVYEYSKNLQNVVDDRLKLKELLTDHLIQFFNWNKIVFDRDFNKVTLYSKRDTPMVIDFDALSDLGMGVVISPDVDDKAFRILKIEVYPFGLPEEED